VFACDKCSSSDKTVEVTALISSSASAAAAELNIAIGFVILRMTGLACSS
jgi:hypothetical protein